MPHVGPLYFLQLMTMFQFNNITHLQQRAFAAQEKKHMRHLQQQQETELKSFTTQQRKDYQKQKELVKKVCWRCEWITL